MQALEEEEYVCIIIVDKMHTYIKGHTVYTVQYVIL